MKSKLKIRKIPQTTQTLEKPTKITPKSQLKINFVRTLRKQKRQPPKQPQQQQ